MKDNKYYAIGNKWKDCPSCDGDYPTSEIIFIKDDEDILNKCFDFNLSSLYNEEEEMVGRIEYKLSNHCIQEVRLVVINYYEEEDDTKKLYYSRKIDNMNKKKLAELLLSDDEPKRSYAEKKLRDHKYSQK